MDILQKIKNDEKARQLLWYLKQPTQSNQTVATDDSIYPGDEAFAEVQKELIKQNYTIETTQSRFNPEVTIYVVYEPVPQEKTLGDKIRSFFKMS